jgi:uncharacterized membrane protein
LADAKDIPVSAINVFIDRIGYIQHLDTGALSRLATDAKARIFVRMIPGQLIDPTRPVASVDGVGTENVEQILAAIRTCFSVDDTRSYNQDPRFGASVLSEIASGALSPAVNDPGTAIDVINRALRVVAVWNEPVEASSHEAIEFESVYVPPILLEDAKIGHHSDRWNITTDFSGSLVPILPRRSSLILKVRIQVEPD